MYGRNLLIPESTGSYQKTPLDPVKSLDVKTLKTDLCKAAGIPEESILFNLYGELMCNKSLYNYATDKLGGTHQIFGAMVKVNDITSVLDVAKKLGEANFACTVRSDADEDDDAPPQTSLIMLFLNPTLKALVQKYNYSTVPLVAQYPCLYDLITSNFDWLNNGMGEGLVLISPWSGNQCTVSKWKNGSEASANNISHLNNLLAEIGSDNTIFGEKTDQAKDLFTKMLIVAQSKKVNGADPKPEVKAAPVKKTGPAPLSEARAQEYKDAIKSAQSKFDHHDTYFAKNMKGVEEYTALLVKETLSDIKVDQANKEAVAEHQAIVAGMVKEMFVTYKKESAKKK